MDISEIFRENGPLSGQLPGYKLRAEQVLMAQAVFRAIAEEKVLIVEAGTGVGKSLAYLVPFIYWAYEQERRVVISTFTKALQHQLVEKDIPFLQKALGIRFNYALCVGGENYLCLRRLERAARGGLFDTGLEQRQLEDIFEWRMHTKTGLVSELDFQPSESLWEKICRQPDMCLGKKCLHCEDCFYRKAKKQEFQSQILVVNHHLFFANLSSGEKVLPEYDAIVFDEAQNIEDVATDYLGIEISNFKLKSLFDSISGSHTGRGLLSKLENFRELDRTRIEKLVSDARLAADIFFSGLIDKFPGDTNTLRVRTPDFIPDNLSQPLLSLSAGLKALAEVCKDEEEKIEINALSDRARTIADEVDTLISQSLDGYVYWAEISSKTGTRQRIVLHASPVDISGLMREMVFQRVFPVVLTSATLTIAGSFSFFKERLGLDSAEEILLGSPFNYRENALLYLPSDLPDPGKETRAYINKVSEEIEKILEISRGNTFVLFTSFSMLEKVYESLKGLPYIEILCQGDLPGYKMLEKFKSGSTLSGQKPDRGFVLFGTNTFWQGVDVPGSALECVIITKLPFAVPDDPIIEARTELLQSQGRDPFISYYIPHAVVMLKQGFGRLIRTAEDRGMVAILDPRLRTRKYGKIFLESLPECRVTSEIRDVAEFFAAIRA